jgi:hypothetical protein
MLYVTNFYQNISCQHNDLYNISMHISLDFNILNSKLYRCTYDFVPKGLLQLLTAQSRSSDLPIDICIISTVLRE